MIKKIFFQLNCICLVGMMILSSCKKEFTITVQSNNEEWGTVFGGGTYAKGAEVRINAIPEEGCYFKSWNDGNTSTSRYITVEKKATYTATFAKAQMFTISVKANNDKYGTTIGSGTFQQGTIIQIKAIPNSGYHFEGWNDGNMNNPRTITITANATYTANFAQGDFYIHVTSNNEEWGTVSGGGAYNRGATATLTATPKTDCKFVKWDDNYTSNPRTITVNANGQYEAIFAQKSTFTITVASNNTSWGTVSGGGTYKEGTSVTLTATAAKGYNFIKWSDGNTTNPRTIIVEANASYTATFERNTLFSVSSNQKVEFSPGNLQWSAKNGGSTATTHTVAGNGTAAGTWRFAPNQWDVIGSANSNVSSTYTGWIDLFGWGTSGYNNKYPYMTSTIETDYGNGANNIANTNYDWGVYNAIYNPKTRTTDAPSTWRTLTHPEWFCLLNSRNTTSGIRYAKAIVNGVEGLIIVPDGWSKSTYTLNNTNISDALFSSNVITVAQWTTLEAAGCIFLPAAGQRSGTSVNMVGVRGDYWSSNYNSSNYAYYLIFSENHFYPSYTGNRDYGRSIRLVRNAE